MYSSDPCSAMAVSTTIRFVLSNPTDVRRSVRDVRLSTGSTDDVRSRSVSCGLDVRARAAVRFATLPAVGGSPVACLDALTAAREARASFVSAHDVHEGVGGNHEHVRSARAGRRARWSGPGLHGRDPDPPRVPGSRLSLQPRCRAIPSEGGGPASLPRTGGAAFLSHQRLETSARDRVSEALSHPRTQEGRGRAGIPIAHAESTEMEGGMGKEGSGSPQGKGCLGEGVRSPGDPPRDTSMVGRSIRTMGEEIPVAEHASQRGSGFDVLPRKNETKGDSKVGWIREIVTSPAPKHPGTSVDPPLEPSLDEETEEEIRTSSAGRGSDERVLVLCDECRLHSPLRGWALSCFQEPQGESDRARRGTSLRWRSIFAIEIRRVRTSFFFTTRGVLETEPLDDTEPSTQVGKGNNPPSTIYTLQNTRVPPCSCQNTGWVVMRHPEQVDLLGRSANYEVGPPGEAKLGTLLLPNVPSPPKKMQAVQREECWSE